MSGHRAFQTNSAPEARGAERARQDADTKAYAAAVGVVTQRFIEDASRISQSKHLPIKNVLESQLVLLEANADRPQGTETTYSTEEVGGIPVAVKAEDIIPGIRNAITRAAGRDSSPRL